MSHEANVREYLERRAPGEALLYFAAALDDIEDRLAARGSDDPWAIPPAPVGSDEWAATPFLPDPPAEPEQGWTPEKGKAAYDAEVTRIQAHLADAPEAYGAAMALAKDLLKAPTLDTFYIKGELLGGTHYTTGEEDTPVEVDISDYAPERIKNIDAASWRQEWGLAHRLDQPDWLVPDGGQPILETFIKGGPMVLYLGYREWLTQIPAASRSQLVRHVEDCGFPGDATIMGHDLLRADDTQDYERALGDAGSRSSTLPGGRG